MPIDISLVSYSGQVTVTNPINVVVMVTNPLQMLTLSSSPDNISLHQKVQIITFLVSL